MKVNQKQFSEILNVTPQAIGDHTKRGRIIRDDNTGLYDLSHKENRAYLKEKGIDVKKISIPKPTPAGRPVVSRPQGKIKSVNPGSEETQSDLKKENIRLKNEKLKAELEIINRNFIPCDFIESQLMRYIAKLHSNIERTAMTNLITIGKEILVAGEVTAPIIEKNLNTYLTLCHNTREEMLRELANFKLEGGKK